MKLNTEKLLQIGFVDLARWFLVEEKDSLNYEIDNETYKVLEDAKNVLYAFTNEEKVLYIGKTTRGIGKRFVGYCKPGKSQRTNIRCHEKIKESLQKKTFHSNFYIQSNITVKI